MEVGIHLPQVGQIASRDAVLDLAREAEDSGLSSVWVSDHVVFPSVESSRYPYSADGKFPVEYSTPFIEMVVLLAMVAGGTESVKLGTSVLVMPLRNTLLTTKQLGSLAFLAPSRLIIAVGTGWLKEEFELLDADFAHRGQLLDEQVQALRGLLGESDFGFSGKRLGFPALKMEPRPTEVPPIWIGGTSPPAIRRAGRLGDAWHAIAVRDTAQLVQLMNDVRAHATKAGRSPEGVGFTVRIGARAERDYLEKLRSRLAELSNIGCCHVVIDPVYTASREAAVFCRGLGEFVQDLEQPQHD
ncbi:MAG: TIGR03619 family F420-dependent LLM class oxidoreductase [Actinobacteria bacterium]|nr:TIGR03619 family F420-dependent LLM class oxidoreductase [Actinomycetota bacterium]